MEDRIFVNDTLFFKREGSQVRYWQIRQTGFGKLQTRSGWAGSEAVYQDEELTFFQKIAAANIKSNKIKERLNEGYEVYGDQMPINLVLYYEGSQDKQEHIQNDELEELIDDQLIRTGNGSIMGWGRIEGMEQTCMFCEVLDPKQAAATIVAALQNHFDYKQGLVIETVNDKGFILPDRTSYNHEETPEQMADRPLTYKDERKRLYPV